MLRDSDDTRRHLDDEPVEQCDANGEMLKEFEELVAELLIAEANFRLATLGERPKYLGVREAVRALVLKRYAEAVYARAEDK